MVFFFAANILNVRKCGGLFIQKRAQEISMRS